VKLGLRTLLTALVLELLVRDVASCATPPPPVKDAGQCVVIVVAGVDAGSPEAGAFDNPGF